MKKIIQVVFLLLSLLPLSGFAQGLKPSGSPVMWDFSVSQQEPGTYRVEAKAILQPGFHIWALDAGGDGSLIATSFATQDVAEGEWKDKGWMESKAPVVQRLEFIEGAIRWHEKEINFYREITAPGGTEVNGTVTFQTCNDQMCFPPEDLDFSIVLPE